MNIILVGDDFPAVQLLKMLSGLEEFSLQAVYTSSRETGFGQLGNLAEGAGIPCRDSERLKTENEIELLSNRQLDWLLNVNSTVILPDRLLELPTGGAVNLHPGLLPEYAGLHTHQWALRNGEPEFGATIHFITPRLDTGDIILQERFPIEEKDTGLTLYHKCIRAGTLAMKQVVEWILEGEDLPREPQDLSRRRLYRHRDALDSRIDWTMPAEDIERFVRAGNYAPLQSPTYTASIQTAAGEMEILEAAAQPVTREHTPGTVPHSNQESVGVQCGEGSMILLEKVRWKNGGTIDNPELAALLPEGTLLPGREKVGKP